MEIKLNDLLHFSGADMDIAKIKFNQSSPDSNPLDLYQQDPEIVNIPRLFWKESAKNIFMKDKLPSAF